MEVELVWRKHDGGKQPVADDCPVDLQWGFGVVAGQPASKVNWSFHWTWRPTPPRPSASPRQENER